MNMNKNELKQILNSLIALQKRVRVGRIPESWNGICYNLAHLADCDEATRYIFEKYLKDNVSEWPKFSGSITFPVKSPSTNYSAEESYLRRIANPWEGSYGQDRKELLQWCIDRITKQLEEL